MAGDGAGGQQAKLALNAWRFSRLVSVLLPSAVSAEAQAVTAGQEPGSGEELLALTASAAGQALGSAAPCPAMPKGSQPSGCGCGHLSFGLCRLGRDGLPPLVSVQGVVPGSLWVEVTEVPLLLLVEECFLCGFILPPPTGSKAKSSPLVASLSDTEREPVAVDGNVSVTPSGTGQAAQRSGLKFAHVPAAAGVSIGGHMRSASSSALKEVRFVLGLDLSPFSRFFEASRL